MSYESIEQSVSSGEPVELYDFVEADGTHYRNNTSNAVVTYGSYDYEPGILDRDDMELGGNAEVNTLQVKLCRGHPLTNKYVSAPAEGEVSLTVYQQHAGFTVTFWQGYLMSVSFDNDGVPTARFTSPSSEMPGVGQRRRNQRLCDYCLYKTGCRVNAEAFRVDGTITNVSGLVITSPAFATRADDWFKGGEIVTGVTRRLIKAHATNTVTVTRTGTALAVGASFRAYAGCDHLPTTCDVKFSNKPNYGGNENLPVKNPYMSGTLY